MDNLTACVLVKNDEYWLRYALESTRSWFKNYVFYDVNSEDKTKKVIEEFLDTCDDSVIAKVRLLPECPPSVQGAFRNSMISEAGTDWYYILDGDEIYDTNSVKNFEFFFNDMIEAHKKNPNKIYGVIKRREIYKGLDNYFNEIKTHHRLYHRTATWIGPHPGEAPFYNQNSAREIHTNKVLCYHFHHPDRSPLDGRVPKRMERKSKQTYSPGELKNFDLFSELPILKKRFGTTRINPVLEKMQQSL